MPNWPEKELIKFVEWRVLAFEASRRNVANGLPPEQPDHPLSEVDLNIWLAKIRDKKSLTEIARKEYPKAWNTAKGKRGNQRAVSRVRNSIIRVEGFLNRDGKDFKYPKKWKYDLDSALRQLLLK